MLLHQIFATIDPDTKEKGRYGFMNAYENVEIFEDTKRLCEKNEKRKAAVAESVKGQKLIPESKKLPDVDKMRFSDEAKVVVSTKRTFEAASGYSANKIMIYAIAASG